MNTNLKSVTTPRIWDIPAILIVLVFTIAIPFFVHLIPFSGTAPIGARLLPMFYAPFVAIIFFRFRVGLIAGILAPLMNYWLTGQPAVELVMLLCVELGLFSVIIYLLLKKRALKWVAAPFSYILTKLISSLSAGWLPQEMSYSEFLSASLSNALPGLFALLVINLLVLLIWKNKN